MHAIRTFVALSVATLAAACAGSGDHHARPPSTGMAPMARGAAGPMAAMDPRMQAMQEMHQKMVNATTPAERQALMAEHMKAMQGGMRMMEEMQALHAGCGMVGTGMMGSYGSAAAMPCMGDGGGMPADMAQRQPLMSDHMTVMQRMMDMMADRVPPSTTAP